jgi:predicted ATPase
MLEDLQLSMSRIVITGGPGAGKTTLLLALQARGYTSHLAALIAGISFSYKKRAAAK